MVDAPRPMPDLDPGIFISNVVLGYVPPTPETCQRILTLLKAQDPELPQSVIRQLLMIKLLAPEASRDLIIYNAPEARSFIKKVSHMLAHRYQGDRHGDSA